MMIKLISNAALLGVIASIGYWVFSWVDTGDTTLAIFKTAGILGGGWMLLIFIRAAIYVAAGQEPSKRNDK